MRLMWGGGPNSLSSTPGSCYRKARIKRESWYSNPDTLLCEADTPMGFLVARTHACLSFRCFLKGEIPTFWPQAVVNNITFAVFECLKKKCVHDSMHHLTFTFNQSVPL